MTDSICIPKEFPDFIREQLAGLRKVLPDSICLQCNFDIFERVFYARFVLPIVTSLELEENNGSILHKSRPNLRLLQMRQSHYQNTR